MLMHEDVTQGPGVTRRDRLPIGIYSRCNEGEKEDLIKSVTTIKYFLIYRLEKVPQGSFLIFFFRLILGVRVLECTDIRAPPLYRARAPPAAYLP